MRPISTLCRLISASWQDAAAELNDQNTPSSPELDDNRDQVESLTLALSAIDSEFKALRSEIGRLIDHQKDLHNLSFVSLAALLAFIGVLTREIDAATSEGPTEDLTVVLLLVPLLSLQFALTAADLTRRIRQLAAYLGSLSDLANAALRRTFPDSLAPSVWQWEEWKSARYSEACTFDKLRTTGMEKSRWLALAFPGLLGIGSYIALDPSLLGGPLEWSLFISAALIMAYSIWALVRYPAEAQGIETPREHAPS